MPQRDMGLSHCRQEAFGCWPSHNPVEKPGGAFTYDLGCVFYDIQLDDVTGVESLAIEFRPAVEDKAIYHWNGENRRSALTKATMKRRDVYGYDGYS